MSILRNILKRSVYPVETPCGVIHLRELTFAELTQVKLAKESQQAGLTFAMSLVSSEGTLLLPRVDGESDESWSERMVEEMQHMEGSTIKAINDRMKRWYLPATEKQTENLTKN